MADFSPSPKEILSEQHQEISQAPFSFALSEFSSQLINTVGDTKCNFDIESIPVRAEDNNMSHENAYSPSAMEVSMNFALEKSEEQMLSLDLSKMSVKENDEHSIRESNKNEESPTRVSYLNENEVSPIKVSESNENFESPMKEFESNKKDQSSVKTSAQIELVNEQSLEMSIQEVVKEEKIAALDRSLMLATTIPSYTKLLSQCRRVKDLQTLVQSDMNCIRKIGEGSFGEVFMGQDTVYKVVPVGGDEEINDVEQTTFENAFQEIAVSRKLSDLAGDQVQMGKAFCQLKDVVFCKGKYPEVLLTAWDNFQGSENQRPDILPEDQMYVVLLCKYSGVQLEEYCAAHKLTPHQAHSIVRQICCSLAAAEQLYEFEHRDLHWGNVLIAETGMEHVEFTQDGKTYILKSHGLLATIIDFTFSRLETEGCLNYVDLEHEDWLFQGDVKADIQYRVYRDMRSACRKNWAKFTPKTNLLWLLYLIDKMNIKIRSSKLRHLRQALQSCKSSSAALPIAFRSL
ncbi:serine/threonine-protein kinase haspin-like [Bolinopsis microptera]|uniref:serine/threonine-protein kinase haspin-like n=1 Tax=Bolinopsis microptera TaxID=2820187 RepID=UPI003078B87D